MRNHKKVKAIRSKFGPVGYCVWSMVLEYLTGNDGNVFEYSDLEFELMSGDFGIPATEIRAVVDYCVSLEMLFNVNGFIKSESLDERLAPVYQKRGAAKELSKKQLRENGKFVTSNPVETVVSVAETPQSKVKESKVKEREYTPPVEIFPAEQIQKDERFFELITMRYKKLKVSDVLTQWEAWYVNKFDWRNKTLQEMKFSFESWLKDPKPAFEKKQNPNPYKVQ